MTKSLPQQQQENKEKFVVGFTKTGGRYGNSTYIIRDLPEIKSFIDEITASTWKAATEAEMGRVRAIAKNLKPNFEDGTQIAVGYREAMNKLLAALDTGGTEGVDNSLA